MSRALAGHARTGIQVAGAIPADLAEVIRISQPLLEHTQTVRTKVEHPKKFHAATAITVEDGGGFIRYLA